MNNEQWLLVAPISIAVTAPNISQCGEGRSNSLSIHDVPERRMLVHTSSLPDFFGPSRRRSRRRSSKSSRDSHCTPGERWNWFVEKLKPVPKYYVLEATCMRFCDVPCRTISKRISNFLRVNSVCSTYHGDWIECITCSFLKFNVQLWEGHMPGDVVVEVQRRQGCVLQMRKLRRGMLTAIMSEEAEVQLNQNQPSFSFRHSDDDRDTGSHKRTKLKKERCLCSLKSAERMMKSISEDEQKLGMECLNSLVGANMEGDSTASCIAEAIVCGTGKHVDLLRGPFMDFFRETTIDEEDNTEGFGDDELLGPDEEFGEYLRGRHFGALHTLALEILAKSLKRVQDLNKGGSLELKLDIRSWFWRTVIESLVYNVEVADSRPLEAALSTKCLSLMMRIEPETQHHRCVEERLIPGLVFAHNFGRAHNLKLETESETLMNALY